MSKKIILNLGAVGTIISSASLFAISCGSNKSGDKIQNEDFYNPSDNEDYKREKIVIGAGFSQGKAQWNAVEKIVNVYNETQKNRKGFKPVELVRYGNDYGSNTTTLIANLKANKKKDIPNLIFNYAPTASAIADKEISNTFGGKNMLLNFESQDNELSTNINIFHPNFQTQNKNTENVNPDGTYIIPALKSTVAMGINAPVLGYLISEMSSDSLGDKKMKVDEKFKNSELYKNIISNSESDKESVKKLWGSVDSNANFSSITLSEDTFASMEELLKFGDAAKQGFTTAKTNNNIKFLGVDDPASFPQIYAFAGVNGRLSNFFVSSIKENGKVKISYNNFTNPDNPAIKTLGNIYSKLKESFEKGSVALFGGGEYTSSHSITHKIAIGIGSTAGYSYNFTASNKKITTFELQGLGIQEQLNDKTYKNAGKGDYKYKDNTGKEQTKEVLKFDRYGNNILFSTDTPSGYDIKSSDAETDKKITELLKKIAKFDKNMTNGILVFLDEKDENNKKMSSTGIEKIGNVEKVEKDGTVTKSTIYYVYGNNSKLTKTELTNTGTLQENEFISLEAPGKWQKENTKNIVYGQGPSLIGVRTNKENDDATRAFVKWLTSDEQVDFDGTKMKPWQYLGQKASYIFPVQGFEKNDLSREKNGYIKVAHKGFSEAVRDGSNYVIYDELAGKNSDAFRKELGQAFKTVYTKIKNNDSDKPGSFNDEIITKVSSKIRQFK
ncbi:P68 family surface lipoprotein [Mycoplasma tauri]|uniref:P68 family surface lipoprotein n=1 Tax=Mycoplasma tauri TaxID=547987 RepID=UPI001CC02B76|nr:P80 family lipoprotein [Mycoplasma tauri]MBZ4226962.1 P80 family lipoprotein [Mycoplasma tauri]